MMLGSSPDWLPAGWTLQSRVQKTGRKITHYMNLDTGEKLFSKDDLIRHTKMGNPQCNGPHTVSRQIRPSNNGHAQAAVRSNEHPDWLPDGWFVELKTYKSGVASGRQYKCYYDPSTGFRFYSKPEVFRYLNNVKQKNPKSTQEKAVHSTNKVVIEKYPADDLPPGWIKELKIRKSARGKRKDPYYTNPACDYVFRSKKDVFRYLETGEISRLAFLPKERKIINQKCTHDEITPLSAAKRDLLENGTEKINNAKANNSGKSWKKKELKLPRRSSKRLAGLEPELVAHDVALQTPSTKHCEIKTNIDKVLVDDVTHYLRIGHKMVISNQASAVVATQSTGEPISTSKMPPCGKAVLREKPEMIESKKIHDDTSAVQSLFSSDPCLKFVTEKTHTSAVPVKEAANKEIVCAIPANILQEKNLGETSMGSSGSKKTSIKKKKELNIPCRSSKRLAGLAPELVVNSSSSEQPLEPTTTIDSCYKEATQDVGLASENLADGACQPLDAGPVTGYRRDSSNTTSVSCTNKSKEPLQDQIFPTEKCQKLVTEKMYNEKSKLQFSFPFTNSWSDPCLEFAIKTLTGAIPLEDAVNNELISAPSANIMQENNIGKTVMQSDSTETTVLNSSKSKKRKNNKELNLPRRSSKRLAVLTLKKFVDSCSSKQAIATAASNYCNKESIQVTGLTSENLANGSCQQQDPEAITGLRHDSMHTATALHEELSTKSKEPLQRQTVYADQCHKLDDEKMSSEKSEPQIRFPFVNSWSDTCLEFAVKTLTASIPLEDAAIDGLVSPPATNILQEKNLGEAINGSSRLVKTSLDSNKSKTKKKDLNMPCRSSKRLSRLATQLVVNSLSTEQTFTVERRDSFDEEIFQNAGSIPEKLVDGAWQQLQTEPIMGLKDGFRCTAGTLHEESSSKSEEEGKEPLQDQTVPTDQCQKPDYGNIYDAKSKPQFLFPLGDSWSDPCLEFAFKTLTGAIAVEDNLAVQDYFQQHLDTSSTKRDGDYALPDFGPSNFFKSDLSSHFDAPEKTSLRQQPPANVSLPSGGDIGSQQPCMGGVGNYPAK